jgi:hypothetical protein
MKTRITALRRRYAVFVLVLGPLAACTDATGPGRRSVRATNGDYRQTVIGPPGTNGEWWVRGDLVQDRLPPDN